MIHRYDAQGLKTFYGADGQPVPNHQGLPEVDLDDDVNPNCKVCYLQTLKQQLFDESFRLRFQHIKHFIRQRPALSQEVRSKYPLLDLNAISDISQLQQVTHDLTQFINQWMPRDKDYKDAFVTLQTLKHGVTTFRETLLPEQVADAKEHVAVPEEKIVAPSFSEEQVNELARELIGKVTPENARQIYEDISHMNLPWRDKYFPNWKEDVRIDNVRRQSILNPAKQVKSLLHSICQAKGYAVGSSDRELSLDQRIKELDQTLMRVIKALPSPIQGVLNQKTGFMDLKPVSREDFIASACTHCKQIKEEYEEKLVDTEGVRGLIPKK